MKNNLITSLMNDFTRNYPCSTRAERFLLYEKLNRFTIEELELLNLKAIEQQEKYKVLVENTADAIITED